MKKVIRIKGGLGNQMFQYAFGKFLISKGEKIVFDTSFFEGNKKNKDTDRSFLLKEFNIENSFFLNLPQCKLKDISIKILRKLGFNIDEFHQSPKFANEIKSELLKEFTLKNQSTNFNSASTKIEDRSVSIHIRHGDYLNNLYAFKYHGVLGLEYYKKAYEYIKKYNPTQFVVFSDDTTWTKENINFIKEPVIYASDFNLSAPEELILMSKCTHNIIANSTFSWWSAWLNQNPNKIVIAPKQWTVKKTSDELDIIPKTWIQI